MSKQNAWKTHCRELAAWAWDRLAIKRDRHGLYSADGSAAWTYSPVTKDELAAHFAGEFTLGLGATSVDDQCLWVAWDLDNHVSDETTNQNLDYAIVLMNRLLELGFKCVIIEDSDGKGGIHLWVLFSSPVPAATAHKFAAWLVRDAAEHNIDKVELRPHSPTVQDTAAKCGLYLRTPGKHHKRDHWSRFWGDGEWLDLDASVRLLLSQEGDDPALIPEIKTPPVTKPVVAQNWRSDDAVVERARKYVARIPGAISGSSGHNTTFHVACVLVIEFDLTQDQAFDVISEWNTTCQPPWSEHELQHKVESASKAVGERGRLRNAKPDRYDSITVPSYRSESPPKKAVVPVADYVPFPVGTLPAILRSFVCAVSAAIGCDAAFVVLPALAACASAIGNTRRLRLKRGWFVPPILWCVNIGESGTQKSPAQRAVIDSIKKRQQDQLSDFEQLKSRFKAEEREYKAALKKSEKSTVDLPDEPLRPLCERCLVADTTIEGLVPILKDNWRGVLLSRDELVGWIGSFDKYAGRGSASADASHWLSIYNAESIVVDRKTGDVPSVFVPDAAVCITGGIQPGILNRALSDEHRENGLMARLLIAYPPRQPKQWRDEEIPQADEDAFSELLNGLFGLKPDTGADGRPKPAVVNLDSAAREIVKTYVNANGMEQAGLTGDLAAAWSKLEETPARLALIIHCIRFVCGERVDPWTCDADSMQAGVTLATWFKNEIERVYHMLSESQEQRQLTQLVEWIKARGGRVRARDVVAGRRDIKTADAADELLTTLANAGYGRWENAGGQRGREAREFVLSD